VGYDIGFGEALGLTLQSVHPLPPVEVAVEAAVGMAAAADVAAAVDSPSQSASLKDGYAVQSRDVESASPERPVRLRLAGCVPAGAPSPSPLSPGHALEVMTGAAIPGHADAVLAVEFTRREGDTIVCVANARPGRNILPQGSDVSRGTPVVRAGDLIGPATCGLLAAAGLATVPVHPRPRVALLATGDEVVAPGETLAPGQLYASNVVTLAAWLGRFRMETETLVVPDNPESLREAVADLLSRNDALLTSGGAWKSRRDLTVDVLAAMGWEQVYHRVRLGPGKAVAMGKLGRKVVFCLPGGPPSNEMAFLELALPGLLAMAGLPPRPFPLRQAILSLTVEGDPGWTQVIQVRVEESDGTLRAHPLEKRSRLQCQAEAQGLLAIPEGTSRFEQGTCVPIQMLCP
jgi:molybdopterin molybdotransferase